MRPNVELSGRQRQDARPDGRRMCQPGRRAWWPAVGAPLERVVRPRQVEGNKNYDLYWDASRDAVKISTVTIQIPKLMTKVRRAEYAGLGRDSINAKPAARICIKRIARSPRWLVGPNPIDLTMTGNVRAIVNSSRPPAKYPLPHASHVLGAIAPEVKTFRAVRGLAHVGQRYCIARPNV